MVKRDLADTLKYEGYIIRHDNVGKSVCRPETKVIMERSRPSILHVLMHGVLSYVIDVM